MLLELYENKNGKAPVDEFINSLKLESHRIKIVRRIEKFEKMGLELLANKQKLEKLTNTKDLYELKIRCENRIEYRIICCVDGLTACLLHAFKKKSQSKIRNEIRLANQRAKIWRGVRQ